MKYDLIVIGGGTAGCACAYTAGKLGLKTLIIEKNSFLGGAMTSALVTPAMKTISSYNTDFYNTLIDKLNTIGGQITYCDDNQGWFNPELLKIALDSLMTDANVDVLFNAEVEDVKIEKKSIKSIKIKSEILLECIETNNVVDSTGNSDFCQKINCKFLEIKNFQPMNLRFIMSGVNVEEFSNFICELDKDKNVTTSCVIDGHTHLSTAYTWDTNKNWALKDIFAKAISDGVITEADSNYFQLFTIAGMPNSIAFNAPRLVSESYYNPLDINHTSNLLKQGRESIYRLSLFCKKYLIGFENSYISSIANELGVRNSRQIKGKYVYTIDDLKSGKKFDNACLISDYPIDIHSNSQNESKLEEQKPYHLPITALISSDYDNLFVAGRNLSADFEAQAALRIIPSCFSMGEGVAKYIAQQANRK